MYISPTRSRAAVANNRRSGLGLICFMLMAAILLLGLPSESEPRTSETAAAILVE